MANYIKNLDLNRSRKYDLREVFNAIMYLVKTGCLPIARVAYVVGRFSPMADRIIISVFGKNSETIEVIHELLVEKIRITKGRNEEPSAAIIDAQSVKNTLVGSEDKGFDAGKKIKGIKRHIIVDTLGLVLAVVIQSASVQDRGQGRGGRSDK